jgi:hypothetical protein
MKKKILILLSIFVLFINFLPSKSQNVEANGAIVKIVLGSAAYNVVRGIGEKLGTKMSKNQLDKQVQYLNGRALSGDQKAVNFIENVNSKSAVSSSKPNWEKYVLDPILWLTGADLLVEGYKAFKGAYDGESTLPVATGWSLYAEVMKIDGKCYRGAVLSNGSEIISDYYAGYGMEISCTSKLFLVDASFNANSQDYSFAFERLKPDGTFETYARYKLHSSIGNVLSLSDSVNSYKPVFDDLPDYNNVNNYFINNDYSQVNNSLKPIEIEIPKRTEPQYYSDEPWNDPFTEDEINDMNPNKEPDDTPSGASWWEWLLKPLISAVESIGSAISGLLDLFMKLLVPGQGAIEGAFSGITDSFKSKIPIADQLSVFFTGVKNTTSNVSSAPTFEITLPEIYGGGTYSIIDFTYFSDYRSWVLNFIRFSAWFVFLRRLYNRVPKMIY